MSLDRTKCSYIRKKGQTKLIRKPFNSFYDLIGSLYMSKKQALSEPEFKKSYDPKSTEYLYCTGFNDKHNPDLQKSVPLNKKRYHTLNDYVVIVFTLDKEHNLKNVKTQISALRKRTGNCDYIFYPDINKDNVWYYVFPTDSIMNVNQYKELLKSLLESVATKGLIDVKACESPLVSVPLINYAYKNKFSSIKYQSNQTNYSIDKGFLLETLSPIKKPAKKSVPQTKEDKQKAAEREKKDKRSYGLYQNMIAAAHYLVSSTNPNKEGLKLFRSSVSPNKVEKYYNALGNLERKGGAFEGKYPNKSGANFPKKLADKLSNKINMAKKTYQRNKDTLEKRNRIIMSIANANIKGIINNKTADKIISIFDEVNGKNSKNYKKQFKTACLELKNDPNLKMKAEPISEALRLYQRANNSVSISAQFVKILGKNYKVDPKAPLNDAFNQIKLVYPPALLDVTTQDTDKIVVIFDPLHGFWTHNVNIFRGLLRIIKPTADAKDVRTLISALGSYAFDHDRYIEPYHGNRYLLYQNGVYDTAQPVNPKTKLPDHLISLNSNIVHDLHFTERAYHQIKLKVDPPLPYYDALSYKPAHSNDQWTPMRVLNGYSNFDNHIRSYFLFCLSLGLFSTHNFSVSLDIQGPSGSGKTMLSTIYETIYGASRVNIAPFANLNGRFVFTSYKDNTAIIWFDETNTDAKPLGSRGISTYDSLNDDQARFEVKNKGDHIIDNPPMVFLDGTDFLKTEHPDTGPYRRTLVMKLPNDLTEAKKKTFYTNDFKRLLGKKDVVEWLNWHMIMAYRSKTSVSDRKRDLKLNMTSDRIKQIVPKKALDWREHLRNHDNNITEWFTDVLEPCLDPTINDPSPSKNLSRVQKSFMYHLFEHHMLTQYNQHINDNNGNGVSRFWDAFKEIAAENNWRLVRIKEGSQPRSKSRCRFKKLATTNIDFEKYQSIETLPPDYTQHTSIKKQPFGFLTAWFYIEKVPDEASSTKDVEK